MKFNKKENDLFIEVCELYSQVKQFILYSEQIDTDSKSYLQPMKEIRDCMDHLMRVFYDQKIENNKKKKANDNYYIQNIDKAKGHLYRAGFDALDGIYIIMKQKIYNILHPYSIDVRLTVYSDYAMMESLIYEIDSNIVKYRQGKDIAEKLGSLFDLYILDIEKLKPHFKLIMSLQQVFKKKHDDDRKKNKKILLIRILLGLGLLVLGGIFKELLSRY